MVFHRLIQDSLSFSPSDAIIFSSKVSSLCTGAFHCYSNPSAWDQGSLATTKPVLRVWVSGGMINKSMRYNFTSDGKKGSETDSSLEWEDVNTHWRSWPPSLRTSHWAKNEPLCNTKQTFIIGNYRKLMISVCLRGWMHVFRSVGGNKKIKNKKNYKTGLHPKAG